MTDATLRRPLRHSVARSLPDLAVLAYSEVPADLLLEPAGLIRPEDFGPAAPGGAVSAFRAAA